MPHPRFENSKQVYRLELGLVVETHTKCVVSLSPFQNLSLRRLYTYGVNYRASVKNY